MLLRGNLINRAVGRLSPALADVPHGTTDVPLGASFGWHWLGNLVTSFKDRYRSPEEADPHWTQGPWPDHVELVRTHDFIRETLDAHEDVIRRLPFLSWDGVNDCYGAHLNGENKWKELYTLVTFLNVPMVEEAATPRRETTVTSSGSTAKRGAR